MQTINLEVKLKHTFGNLLRKRHVLVVIQNKASEVLLGYKPHFYPKGIYRLIGGGIDEGEDIIESAVREVEEEIGLRVNNSEIELLFEVVVNAKVGDDAHTFTTYLCLLKHLVEVDEIKAGDDIRGVKAFNLQELQGLIEKYQSFEDDFWYESGDEYKHLWQDYGKVYAPIHQAVYDYLVKNY